MASVSRDTPPKARMSSVCSCAQNIHGVVMGDDAQEHVGRVDHGDGEQVVFIDLAGDGFLVFVDARQDDVALHHVFDDGRPARQDQPLQRDESDQPALVIDDIAIVDRFAVGSLVAQELECLADGDVWRQRDVVGCHGGACGAGLITAQAADILALGLGQEGEHRVDDVFVEAVDQVGTLVVRHQMKQLRGVLGGHRLDELLLAIFFEVVQDRGAVARGQDVEDGVGILVFEVFHQLGQTRGVMLDEEVAQAGDFSVLDQLAEVGNEERIMHGPSNRSRRPRPMDQRRPITSLPTKGRRTSGTSIEPSAR